MRTPRQTRSRSPHRRRWSHCVRMAALLLLAASGAVVFCSLPAAAASSTDSIFVSDYPTSLVEPLPAGTPDVATPLTSALTEVCQLPLPSYQFAQLSAGEVLACFTPQFGNDLIVVGTGNVGILLGAPYGTSSYCGVALYVFPVSGGNTATVGIAPPGTAC